MLGDSEYIWIVLVPPKSTSWFEITLIQSAWEQDTVNTVMCCGGSFTQWRTILEQQASIPQWHVCVTEWVVSMCLQSSRGKLTYHTASHRKLSHQQLYTNIQYWQRSQTILLVVYVNTILFSADTEIGWEPICHATSVAPLYTSHIRHPWIAPEGHTERLTSPSRFLWALSVCSHDDETIRTHFSRWISVVKWHMTS